MRKYSAREMLNKLRWHPEYDFSRVTVVYLDRFHGFLEFTGDEIDEIGHKFVYLKSGAAIPQHRIVEIKYGGESVWRRQ